MNITPEERDRHHRMVLNALENTLVRPTVKKKLDTITSDSRENA
jgi:hypothetical protein